MSNILDRRAPATGRDSVPGRSGAYVETPNIDRIASEGVYFTRGYVSSSTCGPSRAGLLSGIYQQKFGCGENPHATVLDSKGVEEKTEFSMAGLPSSQANLAEMLKERGYSTAVIGKWHLGADKSMRPNSRGFDFFYGFLNCFV